jgi:hypothetical protein
METTDEKAGRSAPELPSMLSAEQKARYRMIADIARRTADRLPHPADKFLEPGHVFDLHHGALRRQK